MTVPMSSLEGILETTTAIGPEGLPSGLETDPLVNDPAKATRQTFCPDVGLVGKGIEEQRASAGAARPR